MLSSRSLTPAVLALALIAGGCDRETAQESQQQAEGTADTAAADGEKALSGTFDRSMAKTALPDFTVSGAGGETLKLKSLQGTPTLVNLWATWCAPCVVELPMLNRLAAAMDGRLRVVTVSQDMENTDAVAPFLSERGLDRLEPWIDPKTDLTFELQAQTLPTTILYDADGKEVWRYVGGNDWTSSESAELIREGLE